MLALAITLLLTLAGLIAAVVIADTLVKARVAYARLMQEGEALRAAAALQAAAVDVRLRAPARPAPRGVTPRLRPAALMRPQLRACAAA